MKLMKGTSMVSIDQLKKFRSLTRRDYCKDPGPPTSKYGDASASYWKLYGRGARVGDKNLVDGLMNNTNSMLILVRGEAHRCICVCIVVSYDSFKEQFVFYHRRIFYHRNIQDAQSCQWKWSADHG